MIDLRRDFEFGKYQAIHYVNLSDSEREMVRQWRNHVSICKWMCQDHRISEEEHKNFIAGLKDKHKEYHWVVKDREKYFGAINITRLDWKNRNGYLGIYSDPVDPGKGAGGILMDCLKKIAFEIAGLHTLKLEVIAGNERALRFYQKQGFTEEGRLKEFVFKDDRWLDAVVMGLMNPQEA